MGKIRSRPRCAAFGLVIVTFLFSTALAPVIPAFAGHRDEEYAGRIQDVYALRSEGKYEAALQEIRKIIDDFSREDAILRDLYNELVKTIHQQRNATTDENSRMELERQRDKQAMETLRRYPDIRAGVGYSTVDSLYGALRARMFGELEIITNPDSCHVAIDGSFRGLSPFHQKYFPVGEYTVRIFKSAYEEKEITVNVEPAGAQTREVVLKKIRGKRWWLARVVAPAAAGIGIILALALSGDDSAPAEDPPLPEPPTPPANRLAE